MASSNIKLFDENKGNMLSDSEFNISNQRMNGLQTGVASSQLQNKAMYQASLIAYAIAQVMMQNGKNANDTDAVSAFVANLSGTMLQKVYDIATTEEAKAGVATGKWMSPALVKAAIDKTLTDKNYLPKSGGTMTGNLILKANPTANLGAATKQYVDTQVNNVKAPNVPYTLYINKSGSASSVSIDLPNTYGYKIFLYVEAAKDGSSSYKTISMKQKVLTYDVKMSNTNGSSSSIVLATYWTNYFSVNNAFEFNLYPVKTCYISNGAASNMICFAGNYSIVGGSGGNSNTSNAYSNTYHIECQNPMMSGNYTSDKATITFDFSVSSSYKMYVYRITR